MDPLTPKDHDDLDFWLKRQLGRLLTPAWRGVFGGMCDTGRRALPTTIRPTPTDLAEEPPDAD